VQVYRFSNMLCTDRGRAINQHEEGWEKTLTGIPKEIFQLRHDYLGPRDYKVPFTPDSNRTAGIADRRLRAISDISRGQTGEQLTVRTA
jgi:hypothetical protein